MLIFFPWFYYVVKNCELRNSSFMYSLHFTQPTQPRPWFYGLDHNNVFLQISGNMLYEKILKRNRT
jgi:hypothetical protein